MFGNDISPDGTADVDGAEGLRAATAVVEVQISAARYRPQHVRLRSQLSAFGR